MAAHRASFALVAGSGQAERNSNLRNDDPLPRGPALLIPRHDFRPGIAWTR
ncbi:hypothetical protein IG631_02635 [Alternaria alternata]|nr:hypothetical protein IG631_02635 [Alternaria alternata]